VKPIALLVALIVLAPPALAQHEQHQHEMSDEAETGAGSAPEPPADHAADSVFDSEAMAEARERLAREHGGSLAGMLVVDIAEYQVRRGRDGFRWEGESWFGGDLNRLVVKSEGEGATDENVGDAEIEVLYSRAISPYFDAQVGVRQDFAPNPAHTYGAIALTGVAPYWFHVTGSLFLSEEADVLARLEGSYDQLITQRLIAQPRVELDFSAQDIEEHEIGDGLSSFELELRLRYEIRRELAPYLGVSWQRKVANTARFARRDGERASSTSLVLGMRFWF
jgi:copper resistance protein B